MKEKITKEFIIKKCTSSDSGDPVMISREVADGTNEIYAADEDQFVKDWGINNWRDIAFFYEAEECVSPGYTTPGRAVKVKITIEECDEHELFNYGERREDSQAV